MSRLLPRFTQPHHTAADPLELAIAARQAREDAAKAAIAPGAPPADPGDLRGIPVIGHGVGGTQPGTDPLRATIRILSVRRTSHTTPTP